MWGELNSSGSGSLLSGVPLGASTEEDDDEAREGSQTQWLSEEEDTFNWPDGSDDDEHEEESDFDYEEVFGHDSSVESELLLPQEQRHRDSWVWKTYVFVCFMVAFTKLSQECATLILSFVFSVIAPLVQQTGNEEQERIQAKDRLVTPAAVARSLGLKDSFTRYLVCVGAGCNRLNIWDGKIPRNGLLYCHYCRAEIVRNGKPVLQYAHRTIASNLALLLQDEQIKDAMEEWKQEQPQDGRYGSIWMGEAWRRDCTQVDCETPCRQQHTPFVDDGDLNLKITLNIDWFAPHKGSHTGQHSTSVVLMRIDNLPERFSTLDRRCFSIHVIGLLPGPKAPKTTAFMRYLKLVTDELIDLDRNGRLIPTAKHPKGRKVRVRLNTVVANSPARAKMVDFVGSFWGDPFCPYCPKRIDKLGTREPWEDGPQDTRPQPPSSETAARCKTTVIKELKYFNLVLNSPPDPMHAVLSGMCQRFWWDFLLDSCSKLGGRDKISKVQAIVSNARLLSSLKKLDNRMGDHGAGPPSAEQWVTMYRCLLPFIMLGLWDRSLIGQRDEPLSFHPSKRSGNRPVLEGFKFVKDVFPIGMLLCCIGELLEEDLDDAGVDELHGYIVKFNVMLKDLLGNGWLTYNTHIAEHIPEAIRRFGASRNFSCLPFERANGRLGRINTSGHRQGKLEATMMRTVVHQLELRHLLAQSTDEFMQRRLLEHVQSRSEQEKDSDSTRMVKENMEAETFRLLLDHLNGPTKSFSGRFVVGHDPTRMPDDVGLIPTVHYLRTVVIETYPSETRVTSVASSRGGGLGNTYALVRMSDGSAQPVHILWLFEKEIPLQGRDTDASRQRYMHVRKLKVVTMEEAMGGEVACKELLARMRINFASRTEHGGETVVPFASFISQLAVVPFDTDYRIRSQVYGLKAL